MLKQTLPQLPSRTFFDKNLVVTLIIILSEIIFKTRVREVCETPNILECYEYI